jgi:hypothetical protein
MALIADLLLIAAALGAAFYCFVLSRRLATLHSVEGGVGKAISTLSDQVERLEQTLAQSHARAEEMELRLRTAVEDAKGAETALTAASSATAAMRPAAKGPVNRSDTQPAAFRRRLFSDASSEIET